MKDVIKKLKAEQKTLALVIRHLKGRRKTEQGGYVPGLLDRSKDYRYQHVVYCLLRGRTISEVEPKTRIDNRLNEALLERIWQHYTGYPYPLTGEVTSEALRPGAA